MPDVQFSYSLLGHFSSVYAEMADCAAFWNPGMAAAGCIEAVHSAAVLHIHTSTCNLRKASAWILMDYRQWAGRHDGCVMSQLGH